MCNLTVSSFVGIFFAVPWRCDVSFACTIAQTHLSTWVRFSVVWKKCALFSSVLLLHCRFDVPLYASSPKLIFPLQTDFPPRDSSQPSTQRVLKYSFTWLYTPMAMSTFVLEIGFYFLLSPTRRGFHGSPFPPRVGPTYSCASLSLALKLHHVLDASPVTSKNREFDRMW